MAVETGSASRFASKSRQVWSGVLASIEAREVDALVTWEASRAQRDLTAYAELRDACVKAAVSWGYSGTLHDLSQREGRFRTGLDALLAEDEASRTSERVQRAVRANAVAGKPHGKNLYGYRRSYDPTTRALLAVEPHPEQGPIVQEICRRLLAGETSHAVAADLNRRDVPPRRPVREARREQLGWTPVAVTEVARKPAYAGLRQHQGQVIGNAAWPPLNSPEDWQKLQAVLDQRPPRSASEWQVRYLLTGIAVCGICGGLLRKGHQNRGRSKPGEERLRYAVYVCPGGAGRGGFHVSMRHEHLDAAVTEAVLARLQRVDFLAQFGERGEDAEAERTSILEEIEGHRAWLNQVRERAESERRLDLLFDQEARTQPKIDAAQRRLRALTDADPVVLDLAERGAVREAWEGLGLPERRRVIRALVVPRVLPVPPEERGRRGINLKRIDIVWR